MKLSHYITENGLTLTELAAQLDLPVQTVSRYACGARRPREAEMLRIFEVTGGKVTPNDFFNLPTLTPHTGEAA